MDFGFIPYNYTIRNIVRDKFEMHTFGAYVIAILSASYKYVLFGHFGLPKQTEISGVLSSRE